MKRDLKAFFRLVYLKLVRINDTPQKISLGLALGVTLGIIPGTGPLAAIALAFILRLNRLAALIGSLMVNTWFSIVTLALAIKLGAEIFSINCQNLYNDWILFIKNFHWSIFFKMSAYKIVLPIFTGYAIISLITGILVYIISIVILINAKRWRSRQN